MICNTAGGTGFHINNNSQSLIHVLMQNLTMFQTQWSVAQC